MRAAFKARTRLERSELSVPFAVRFDVGHRSVNDVKLKVAAASTVRCAERRDNILRFGRNCLGYDVLEQRGGRDTKRRKCCGGCSRAHKCPSGYRAVPLLHRILLLEIFSPILDCLRRVYTFQ